LSTNEVIRRWVTLGYEVENSVISHGQLARRGGILDIWPPAEPLPVRIELFGDEIETLRTFDPATQRTTQTRLERLLITPAREFILPEGEAEGSITDEISEFAIPLLHPQPASLLDYLPKQSLVLLDDQQAIQDTITEIEEQAINIRRDLVAEGSLAADFPIPYLTWAEISDTLPRLTPIELSASLETVGETSSPMAECFSAGPRFAGQLKPFIDYLVNRAEAGERTTIVSRQTSRLEELWKERVLPSAFPPLAQPLFHQGSLSEGWTFTAPGSPPVHLLTDGEIFGWRRPEPRQRHRQVVESPEAAYADLHPDPHDRIMSNILIPDEKADIG
jgi:transcription-repair coupling factor (superfamily II helicase)